MSVSLILYFHEELINFGCVLQVRFFIGYLANSLLILIITLGFGIALFFFFFLILRTLFMGLWYWWLLCQFSDFITKWMIFPTEKIIIISFQVLMDVRYIFYIVRLCYKPFIDFVLSCFSTRNDIFLWSNWWLD